jgi:hypothetical protein
MTPRLFCNVVFAWLLARVTEQDDRDKLLSDLYEPIEGTDSVTRTFLDNLSALGEAG